ncbi:MAG: DNA cytosine methyltransferase, partial [Bacilli bacterium]
MATHKFIDLFAGIGGFRLGFEQHGFECVFSSENNKRVQQIYHANFGETPDGDITQISAESIPPFDVLLAGFPCQPFSVAGNRRGFEDTRGTLFFEIVRIVTHHRPKVIVLENVKNFKNHDKGNTFNTVITTLNDLGYQTSWEVFNAKDFGVPQSRERLIIIATLNGTKFDFSKIELKPPVVIKDILEEDSEDIKYLNDEDYTIIDNPKKQLSGIIFAGYKNKSEQFMAKNKDADLTCSGIHSQPHKINSSDGIQPTLMASETAGRYLIYHNGKVRKLTIKECFRMMGFPDDFKRVGSKAQLYASIGNSIVVPMVSAIAKQVKTQLLGNNINDNVSPPVGKTAIQPPSAKLRIATVFSGIGAVEYALKRMAVAHEVVFACDNGDVNIKTSDEEIREKLATLESYREQKEYIDSLYIGQKENQVKKSYLANYDLSEEHFHWNVNYLDGKQYTGQVDLFVGGSPCQS